MAAVTDWNPVLRGEFEKPYWAELMAFVHEERSHFISGSRASSNSLSSSLSPPSSRAVAGWLLLPRRRWLELGFCLRAWKT